MPMRLLVLLFSVAMPVVAWLSQRGVFGPDNGTVSGQYPTLLVAAGYAFAIWGLIFAFDLAYGLWQATGARRDDTTLSRIAWPICASDRPIRRARRTSRACRRCSSAYCR